MNVLRRPLLICLFFTLILTTAHPAPERSPHPSPRVGLVRSTLTARFTPIPGLSLAGIDYARKVLEAMGLQVVLLDDRDLEEMAHARVILLILPNVKNMTAAAATAIETFAARGGKVLAFHMTSYRSEEDEMAGRRNNFQLADLFGADFLRWSNDPPACQFLLPADKPPAWSGLPEKLELGRNKAMLVKPRPESRILAMWGNGPFGAPPTLPGRFGAAIVENTSGSCIYVGENLLVPENLGSRQVQALLVNLVTRLVPSLAPALPDPSGARGAVPHPPPDYGLPIPPQAIPRTGIRLRVGLTLPVRELTVTARTPIRLSDERGRPIGAVGAGRPVRARLVDGKVAVEIPAARVVLVPSLRVTPDRGDAPLILAHARSNGTYQSRPVRGELEIHPSDGRLQAVNLLDLNQYLAGVVPQEVPFHFPNEALAAMGVVARTFALHSMGRHQAEGFDLCDTVHCQAYAGLPAEAPGTTRAIVRTGKETLVYGAALADTPYHSTCGGVTEEVSSVWNVPPVPYLKAVPDFSDPSTAFPPDLQTNEAALARFLEGRPDAYCRRSSRYRWEERYAQQELEALFRESLPVLMKRTIPPFRLRDLRVLERTPGGRVKRLLVATDSGDYPIPHEEIRWLFSAGKLGLGGLQSTFFTVETRRDPAGELVVRLLGGGWGHGVGMCQFGARGMADRGGTYGEILAHYYPGTLIRPAPGR